MSDFLNSLPVVGHVKGLVHYATGDIEEGNRAMLESTRSTAVLGAGAVGSMAGPAMAAAMGSGAGALWDSVESTVTDKPKGLIKNIDNVIQTSSRGEVPIRGILETTLTISGDMLGGLSGGSVLTSAPRSAGRSAAKSAGKSFGKSTGESIIKSASVPAGETFVKSSGKSMVEKATRTTVDVARLALFTHNSVKNTQEALEKKPPSNPPGNAQPPSQSSKKSRSISAGASGAGGREEPPDFNPKKTCEGAQLQPLSAWREFLNLFNEKSFIVQSLKDIRIQGRAIFAFLENHQINYLKKLIKTLHKKGILSRVMKTIKNILKTLDYYDVTYLNFVSLAEFIQQYLGEHMAVLNGRIRQRQRAGGTFRASRADVIEIVNVQLQRYQYTIVRVFHEIAAEIAIHDLPINFRDIFSAAYHYLKHRKVGRRELSVKEYYALIRSNLKIIMCRQEFRNLPYLGGQVKFERYYMLYGARLLIVVKWQDGRLVLSTAYFLDDSIEGDKEDDIYINDEPL